MLLSQWYSAWKAFCHEKTLENILQSQTIANHDIPYDLQYLDIHERRKILPYLLVFFNLSKILALCRHFLQVFYDLCNKLTLSWWVSGYLICLLKHQFLGSYEYESLSIFYFKTPENLPLWLQKKLWKMCAMQVRKSERKYKRTKYKFKKSRKRKVQDCF